MRNDRQVLAIPEAQRRDRPIICRGAGRRALAGLRHAFTKKYVARCPKYLPIEMLTIYWRLQYE